MPSPDHFMPQSLLRGALYITLAELMFASMGAAVKAVSLDGLGNETLVFLRNAVGMLLVLPLLLRGGRASFHTRVPHLHLLRALMGVSAMYCFFYALGHLALADGMLLKMTAPIFIPLIAWLWFREAPTAWALIALPVGMTGVILILRPGTDMNWIVLIGLAGGLFAAVAKTSVRRLGRTEPPTRTVFYFAVLGGLVSALPLPWTWQAPTPYQWGLVLSVAALGTVGQMLMTHGYARAPAARIAPFTFFSVVFGSSYGFLFWGEILDGWFLAGALLIGLAGVLSVRNRRERTASSPVEAMAET